MSTLRKKMAALGFEPPPLGRGPDAIPLNQSGCKFGQVWLNDDFVCKKNKKNKNKKKIS